MIRAGVVFCESARPDAEGLRHVIVWVPDAAWPFCPSGAAANGTSLSIGRLLILAPYRVPVFAYSSVVTGELELAGAAHLVSTHQFPPRCEHFCMPSCGSKAS